MINLQPTLQNELITLRPLRDEDFEQLYQVAKDPLIWEQHPASHRYKKEIFSEFFNDSIKSKGALIIIENSTQQIIGSSRFKKINNSDNAIEIGWSFLSRDKWGGKYNRAMKELMIDYALEHLEHIVFYIGLKNKRSQKAVEKLGAIQIASKELDHLMRQDGNDLTYVISKVEWNKIKAKH